MKQLAISLTLALICIGSHAHAQVMIDMTRVTCADYQNLPPRSAHVLGAWISGWSNQKRGFSKVDLSNHPANVAAVQRYCSSNPSSTLMNAVQKALP